MRSIIVNPPRVSPQNYRKRKGGTMQPVPATGRRGGGNPNDVPEGGGREGGPALAPLLGEGGGDTPPVPPPPATGNSSGEALSSCCRDGHCCGTGRWWDRGCCGPFLGFFRNLGQCFQDVGRYVFRHVCQDLREGCQGPGQALGCFTHPTLFCQEISQCFAECCTDCFTGEGYAWQTNDVGASELEMRPLGLGSPPGAEDVGPSQR